MELKGSCHCEKVSFKVLSHTPSPVSLYRTEKKKCIDRLIFSHIVYDVLLVSDKHIYNF